MHFLYSEETKYPRIRFFNSLLSLFSSQCVALLFLVFSSLYLSLLSRQYLFQVCIYPYFLVCIYHSCPDSGSLSRQTTNGNFAFSAYRFLANTYHYCHQYFDCYQYLSLLYSLYLSLLSDGTCKYLLLLPISTHHYYSL